MKRTAVRWTVGVVLGGGMVVGGMVIASSAAAKAKVEHCVGNLHQIDGAKDQFALDNGCAAPSVVADLVPTYIKTMPVCAEGGTYDLNNMGVKPTCSREGHVLKPDPVRGVEESRLGQAAASSCVNHLRRIGAAKDQFALDHQGRAPRTLQELIPECLNAMPKCPDGGFYRMNALGVDPTCSKGGAGVSGHRL